MTVSVVIPHRNRAALLEQALASLDRQELSPGVDLDVVVVDNGSMDESHEVAASHGARTVQLGRNLGVSRALNRGIEESRGEWVVLLNNDVRLAPDWLAKLLRAAAEHRSWFATGRVYDASRPDLLDGAGDAVCRGGVAWRLCHGRPDTSASDRGRPTFFPSATASLFRREFFARAGMFDEDFFAYLEDVEVGLRAASLGLAGVYEPQALAWHKGSATAGRWSDAVVGWMTRHQILILAKHYSQTMLLRFGQPVLVAQLLWALLAISRGRTRAWLSGLRSGLAESSRHWRAEGRSGEAALVAALLASESEIAEVQGACGWDNWWKWYFRLARPRLQGL